VRGQLKHTLASANSCESMIETVRRTSRNVKRWSSGDMCLRWTAAGMLEAAGQFRRLIGHRDLAKLAVAVGREIARQTVTTTVAAEVAACPA
jgi:putative transposase